MRVGHGLIPRLPGRQIVESGEGGKAEARRLFKKRLKKMDAVSIDKKLVRLKA